jgi:hypothetical protein
VGNDRNSAQVIAAHKRISHIARGWANAHAPPKVARALHTLLHRGKVGVLCFAVIAYCTYNAPEILLHCVVQVD